jgi:hypothetical protein
LLDGLFDIFCCHSSNIAFRKRREKPCMDTPMPD